MKAAMTHPKISVTAPLNIVTPTRTPAPIGAPATTYSMATEPSLFDVKHRAAWRVVLAISNVVIAFPVTISAGRAACL